VLVLLCDQGL